MTYILDGVDLMKKNERYVCIQILGVEVYTGKSSSGMIFHHTALCGKTIADTVFMQWETLWSLHLHSTHML